MQKTIIVDCDPRLEKHDCRALVPLQGSLKSLSMEAYDKLANSIVTRGFFAPVFVWQDGDILRILDGHQRCMVLATLAGEGWTIPQIPIVRIKAASVTDAKERLLLITSQFGKIERDGLYEFLQGIEKSPQTMIPEVDLAYIDGIKFMEEFYDSVEQKKEPQGSQEISSTRFETFTTKCPKCSFEFDAKRKPDADDE